MKKAETVSFLPPPKEPKCGEDRRARGCVPPPRAPQVRFVEQSETQGPPRHRRRGLAYAAVALLALIVGGTSWFAIRPRPTRVEVQLATPDQARRLGDVLAKLQRGENAGALGELHALERANAAVPSLDYVFALAHLHAGDAASSRRRAAQSLRKGERVSDALALLAAAYEVQARGAGGEPDGKSRALLEQAMNADPANPRPYVEMAMRLRAAGENDAALAMIEEARGRLDPLDFRALLDTTERLIRLEGGEVGPDAGDHAPEGASELFGAAYAALRRGDATRATDLLAKAKQSHSPGTFDFLLGDPAWRKLHQNAAVTRQNP